ncbi:VCBS repeat-containing protein [uncultured Croceitalea sp.]|uniref:VCBS repeat-containing protein n=1 Tax=uncultured Croceitalea sp. TaxID=1798908 RepID=UPI00374F7101
MKNSIYILLILLIVSCKNKEGDLFLNASPNKTGILFQNKLQSNDNVNILDYLYYYNGGGVAVGDINNDGLQDIFFSGNQVKNALYLNKGNLKFEDISTSSGIQGNSTWNTGAIMGDVNGDGFLDIYVCAVVGINGFNGYNELYINNGDNTFEEKAKLYGLDFDSYSSNAAFLDYDLDGDLDLYILNHAVHTQKSFGRVDLRYDRNYQTGDKLMRNDNGKFVEVSEEAGIYGGINGYGLGLSIADFNQDGYPDIYIGNDFHEDDYYYLNNGDGTFTESLRKYFGHTSRFSMGNDVSDINHDGYPDLISLDMLPEKEIPLKSSEGDDNIQIQKLRIESYGYHYQFTRNMLYVNQPSGQYLETALLSGVAATDWSWSALFADYNQDGEQDLFISNGISKRPNDLDFVKYVSNEQIKKKINNTKLVDQNAIDLMPSGAVQNYIFKGNGNLEFKDKSSDWINNDTLVSGATALADFDNDGDVDLVTNNIDNYPTLYINKTNKSSNYLKIKFDYTNENRFGIGTKVFSYHEGKLQYKELYVTRGFQASSEPFIHFGYGNKEIIDSLQIIWPDRTYQVLKNVEVNQSLTIKQKNSKPFNYEQLSKKNKKVFQKTKSNLGINFTHKEDNYIDFIREKLVPYRTSDRGPAIAVGDLNNDGKEDIYFGSSKFDVSKVYLQRDTTYAENKFLNLQKDKVKEEVAAAIFDINGDAVNDIFLGSGGADFYGKAKPLLDSYYIQKDTSFIENTLPNYFENASVVKPSDFDGDGDLDIFIGANVVSKGFGESPNSAILQNNNGKLSIYKDFEYSQLGMITDAIWHDFDNDSIKDLIVIGEWMSPRFFKNSSGKFIEVEPLAKKINGLWQSIIPFDIDNDGDIDYLLGNWGVNSKFKASSENPMRIHISDFDNNGAIETIISTKKKGNYYPLLGLDELASQMVFLRKKFTTYKDFAGKSMTQIFDAKALKQAKLLEVTELRSGYLKNNNGIFEFEAFKPELQIAPITSFLKYDFDNDGKEEVLSAGNYFGVKPYQGRFDSFPGALIKNENRITLANNLGLNLEQKSTRHLNIITLKGQKYLLVTFNNDTCHVYEIIK